MGRARLEIAKQAPQGAPGKQGPKGDGAGKPEPSYQEVNLHVHEVNDSGALDGTG